MIYYLLQDVYFRSNNDPIMVIVLGGALGAVLLFFLISNIVRNGIGVSYKKSGGGGAPAAKHMSIFAMHRVSKSFGLDHDQSKVLEQVLKANGVTDPEHAVSTPVILDKHFKRAYKQIERSADSEDEAQDRMATLFNVRNTIDVVQNTTIDPSSVKTPVTNQAAVLTVNKESYSVKVVSVKKDSISVDCPRNAIGTMLKFPKGTRVSLAFFGKNGKGFSIDSQALGVVDTSFGPALQIAWSQQRAKPMTSRRFRRRETSITCGFYLVRVEEVKGKKQPRMTIDSRRYQGSIVDLSIGGCAIKTGTSVPVGSRLKIEIDYSRSPTPVAALGQVLRMNRGGITSTIMHIKFLKVTRKALNAINTVVFEYSDD